MGNSTNALPVAKKGMKKGWKIALIVMSAVFFVAAVVTPLVVFLSPKGPGYEEVETDKFQLRYYASGNYYDIVKYIGDGGDVVIPSDIDGIPVKNILDNAFDSRVVESSENITSLEIQKGIESIGNYAFYGVGSDVVDASNFDSYLELELPENLTVGSMAFANSGFGKLVIADAATLTFKQDSLVDSSLRSLEIKHASKDMITGVFNGVTGADKFDNVEFGNNVTEENVNKNMQDLSNVNTLSVYNYSGLDVGDVKDVVTTLNIYKAEEELTARFMNKFGDQVEVVNVSPEITKIGVNAFSKFTNLKNLTLGQGTEIDVSSIPNNGDLNITLVKSVDSEKCELKIIANSTANVIATDFTSKFANNVINNLYIGSGVSAIGSGAFAGTQFSTLERLEFGYNSNKFEENFSSIANDAFGDLTRTSVYGPTDPTSLVFKMFNAEGGVYSNRATYNEEEALGAIAIKLYYNFENNYKTLDLTTDDIIIPIGANVNEFIKNNTINKIGKDVVYNGWKFVDWKYSSNDVVLDSTVITEDDLNSQSLIRNLYASWEAQTGTKFTVKINKQDPNSLTYFEELSNEFYGTTAEEIDVVVNNDGSITISWGEGESSTYTIDNGFNPLEFTFKDLEGNVLTDNFSANSVLLRGKGDLVIEITKSLVEYEIEYDLQINDKETGVYGFGEDETLDDGFRTSIYVGADIDNLPEFNVDFIRPGYQFIGWKIFDTQVNDSMRDIEDSFVFNDLTNGKLKLVAVWEVLPVETNNIKVYFHYPEELEKTSIDNTLGSGMDYDVYQLIDLNARSSSFVGFEVDRFEIIYPTINGVNTESFYNIDTTLLTGYQPQFHLKYGITYNVYLKARTFNLTIIKDGFVNNYDETAEIFTGSSLTEESNNALEALQTTVQYLGTINLPIIERAGFTFVGWFNKNGKQYTNETKHEYSADLTLKAKWAPKTNDTKYFVKEWRESLIQEAGGERVEVGGIYYDLYKTEEKSGTVGQKTEAVPASYNGFRHEFNSNDQLMIRGNGDTTVNIYYFRNEYKLIFKLNIEDGTTGKITKNGITVNNDFSGDYKFEAEFTYGTESSLYGVLPKLERVGYEFKGWKDSNNKILGSEDLETFEWTKDTEVYAVWEAKTYTLIIDGNTQTSGENKTIELQYDKASEKINIDFEKTAYDLVGLDLNSSSVTVKYTLANNEFDLSDVNIVNALYEAEIAQNDKDKQITIYAIWKATPYTITYLRGAEDDSIEINGEAVVSKTDNYNVENSFELFTATRDGYTFAGWKVTKPAGNWTLDNVYEKEEDDDDIEAGMYGDVELTAQWEYTPYTITYLRGAEDDSITIDGEISQTKTYNYNIENSFELYEATRHGYTFAGWKVTISAGNWTLYDVYEKEENDDIAAGMYGDVTLTAQWEVNTYTITYNSNGGSAVASQNYTIEDADLTIADLPSLDGYTFTNWLLSDNSDTSWETGTYNEGDTPNTGKTLYGHITLVAQKEANTNTEFKIEHWVESLTQSEGAGRVYKDFTDDDLDNGLWYEKRTDIGEAINSGIGITDTQTYLETTDSNLVIAGFTVISVENVNINGDGSGIAKVFHTRNEYTLTFDLNNSGKTGTIYKDSQKTNVVSENIVISNIKFGASIEEAQIPYLYRNGYIFTGWFTDNIGTQGNEFNFNYRQETEDLTIFAGWTVETANYFVYDWAETLLTDLTGKTVVEEREVLAEDEQTVLYVEYKVDTNGDNTTIEETYRIKNNIVYILEEIREKTGTTDTKTPTSGIQKSIVGFEHETYSQVNISGDGDSIVDIYYNRIIRKITFIDIDPATQEETTIDEISGKFGTVVSGIPPISKIGYTFINWQTEDDVVLGSEDLNTIQAEDIIVYTQWIANTDTAYKVEQWIESLDQSSAEIEGERVYKDFTDDGEDNGVWYELKNTIENTYSGETDTLSTLASEDTNLIITGFTLDKIEQTFINRDGSGVAKVFYTRNYYKLTFIDKGPNGTENNLISDMSVQFETPIEFIPTISRNGYTFINWQTEDDVVLGSEALNTIQAEDIIVYAQWSNALEYTITYLDDRDIDGVEGNDVLGTETYTIEENITILTPSRNGYTFTGWSLAEDEGSWTSGTYTAGQERTKQYGNVILVAQWEVNTYTITYNSNGGSVVAAQEYTIEDVGLTIADLPSLDGYTFTGWSLAEDEGSWTSGTYTEGYKPNTGKTLYGNITLVAQKEANTNTEYTYNTYTESLEQEAGDGRVEVGGIYYDLATTTDTGTTDEETKYTINYPAEEGYTYVGDIEGFTALRVVNTNINGDGSGVVNVFYSRNSYTITYQLNKETGTTGDIRLKESGVVNPTVITEEFTISYKYEKVVETFPELDRVGYNFIGWGVSATATEDVDNIEIPANDSTILYAIWEAKDQTSYIYKEYTESLEQKAGDGRVEVGGIYYDLATTTYTGTTDTETKYTITNPAEEGFVYVGDIEGFTALRVENTNINADGSGIVEVFYSRNEIVVTYDVNERIGSTEVSVVSGYEGSISNDETFTITYKYGETITTFPELSRVGYTFKGWGTESLTIPDNTLKLTAVWAALFKTLTIHDEDPYNAGSYTTKTYNLYYDNAYKIENNKLSNETTGESWQLSEGYDGHSYKGLKANSDDLDENAFNVEISISGDKFRDYTYYIVWQGDATTYTVYHWTESATQIAGDERVYKDFTDDDVDNGLWYEKHKTEKPNGIVNQQTQATALAIDGYESLSFSQTTIEPSNVTVVDIYYNLIEYTITYDSDGGSSVANQTYYVTDEVVIADGPTRAGYNFGGWLLSENVGSWTSGTYTAGQDVEGQHGSITLVAQWTYAPYTIVYDSNGGSAVGIKNYNIGESFKIATAPTRAGYDFGGWLLSENVGSWTSGTYTAGQDVEGQHGSITLVAQWTARTNTSYMIKCWVESLDQNKTFKEETTTTVEVRDEDGDLLFTYTIGKIEGSENQYIKIDSIWYEVKQSGSGSGTTDQRTKYTVSNPAEEGYTYVGDIEGFDAIKVENKNINGDLSTIVNVFYSRNSYKITYNLNEADETTGTIYKDSSEIVNNFEEYYLYQKEITVFPVLARDGYIFMGWGTTADATEDVDNIEIPANDSTILYAIWEADDIEFTVVQTIEGRENETITLYGRTDSTITLKPNDSEFEHDGTNLFISGYTADEDEYTLELSADADVENSITINYHKNEYELKYGLNIKENTYGEIKLKAPTEITLADESVINSGDTLTSDFVVKHKFENIISEFPELTREGYKFIGWGTTADATADKKVENLTIELDENGELKIPILYAIWELVPSNITYIKGNGEGDSDQTYDIDHGFNLVVAPTRNGYTFAGWKVTDVADDSTWSVGVVYNAEHSFNAGMYGNIELTAQWTINTYNITYEVNGGTIDASITYTTAYDFEKSIELATITRNGYTFMGWKVTSVVEGDGNWLTTNSEKEVRYVNTETSDTEEIDFITITAGMYGHVTLEAQWSNALRYAVIYHTEDGTEIASYNGQTNGQTYTTETNFIVKGAYSTGDKKGYDFTNWVVFDAEGNWENGVKYSADSAIGAGMYGIVHLKETWTPRNDTEYTYNEYKEALIYEDSSSDRLEIEDGVYVKGLLIVETETINGLAYYKVDTDEDISTIEITYTKQDGVWYEFNTSTKTGTTDEETTFTKENVRKIFGFTVKNDEDVVNTNINGDPNNKGVVNVFYSRNSYTITYQLNKVAGTNGSIYKNGSEITENFTETFRYEEVKNLTVLTRDGYSFEGWTVTDKNGNWTLNSNPTSTSGKDGNVTLTAQWSEPTTYEITLNYNIEEINENGSKTNKAPEIIKYSIEGDITLQEPFVSGWKFNGWKVTTAAGNWTLNNVYTIGDGSEATIIEKGMYDNVTLTAQWEAIKYEAHYYVDGVYKVKITDIAFNNGAKLSTEYTKPGYTLVGYYVATSAYASLGTEARPAKDIFEQDKNGYIYLASNKIISFGEEPYKDYDLDYAYTLGNTKANSNRVNLVAVWEANKYTITYDSNGGTIDESKTYTKTYTILRSIELAPVSREGYTFDGWMVTTADGNWTLYDVHKKINHPSNVDEVADIAAGKYGDVTLTAQWTPRNDTEFTIEHWVESLTQSAGDERVYKDFTDDDVDNGLWYEKRTENFDPAKISDIGTTGESTQYFITSSELEINGFTIVNVDHTTISVDTSDVVKVFHSRNEYNVSYNSNRESGTLGEISIVSGADGWHEEDKTIILSYKYEQVVTTFPVLAREGYTFKGWRTNSITIPYNHDTVLNAIWEVVEYSIMYNPDGGQMPTEPYISEFTINDAIKIAGEPTKTGCTFGGWEITSADGNWARGTVYGAATQLDAGKFGTVTLTAIWEETLYVISYVDEEGNNPPENTDYYYNKAFTISTPAERNGYTFVGWKITDSNNSWTQSVIYQDSIIKPNECSFSDGHEFFGDVELTAQWEVNTYTITYDSNGGSVVASQNYTIEDADLTIANLPELVGYIFTNWLLSDNANSSWETGTYNEGDTPNTDKTLYGDITLVAQKEPSASTGFKVEHWVESLTQSAGDERVYKDFTDDDVDNGLWYEKRTKIGEAINSGIGITDTLTYLETTDPNLVIAGFTVISVENVNINGDGSGVAKVFHTRNEYTLTFDEDGTYQTYKYEAQLADFPAVPYVIGYNSEAWRVDDEIITEGNNYGWKENKTAYPARIPIEVDYTIHHKQEQLDGSYILKETTYGRGTTEDLTNAIATSYTGFEAVTPIVQKTIVGDGSTVIEIYYTRVLFTIKVDGVKEYTGVKFGQLQTIDAPDTGYYWKGEDGKIYTTSITANYSTDKNKDKVINLTKTVDKLTITITNVDENGEYEVTYGDSITLNPIMYHYNLNDGFTYEGKIYSFELTQQDIINLYADASGSVGSKNVRASANSPQAKPYTITYIEDDGSQTVQGYTVESSITLKDPVYVDGKTFSGWKVVSITCDDGCGGCHWSGAYDPGDSIPGGGNVVLKAIFDNRTINFDFDPNSTTSDGNYKFMDNTSTLGNPVTCPENQEFNYWLLEGFVDDQGEEIQYGSTATTDDVITDIPEGVESVTLKAVYKDVQVTVNARSFNTNRGSVSVTPGTTVVIGTSVTVTATPKAGYAFVAWYTEDDYNTMMADENYNPDPVSENASYSFNATAMETSLIAVFARKTGTFIARTLLSRNILAQAEEEEEKISTTDYDFIEILKALSGKTDLSDVNMGDYTIHEGKWGLLHGALGTYNGSDYYFYRIADQIVYDNRDNVEAGKVLIFAFIEKGALTMWDEIYSEDAWFCYEAKILMLLETNVGYENLKISELVTIPESVEDKQISDTYGWIEYVTPEEPEGHGVGGVEGEKVEEGENEPYSFTVSVEEQFGETIVCKIGRDNGLNISGKIYTPKIVEGYTFEGWYYKSNVENSEKIKIDSSTANYQLVGGNALKIYAAPNEEGGTFYARFVPDGKAITIQQRVVYGDGITSINDLKDIGSEFDLDEHIFGINAESKLIESSLRVDVDSNYNNANHKHYKFIGLVKAGSTAIITAKNYYDFEAGTYYAVFLVEKYDIEFIEQGGTFEILEEGNQFSNIFYYGESYSLTANGENFAGWYSVEAPSGNTYSSDNILSSLPSLTLSFTDEDDAFLNISTIYLKAKHTISVTKDDDRITSVSVDRNSVVHGEKVELTYECNDGYSVKWVEADNEDVECSSPYEVTKSVTLKAVIGSLTLTVNDNREVKDNIVITVEKDQEGISLMKGETTVTGALPVGQKVNISITNNRDNTYVYYKISGPTDAIKIIKNGTDGSTKFEEQLTLNVSTTIEFYTVEYNAVTISATAGVSSINAEYYNVDDANFAEAYINGSITEENLTSSSETTINVLEGEKVTLEGSLKDGYDFDGWWNQDVQIGASLEIEYVPTEDSDIELRATLRSLTLTVEECPVAEGFAISSIEIKEGEESIGSAFGECTVSYGSTVTIIIEMNPGWGYPKIGETYLTLTPTEEKYVYTIAGITSETTVTICWDFWTVTVNDATVNEWQICGEAVEVDGDGNGEYYIPAVPSQTVLTATANVQDGWIFTNWTAVNATPETSSNVTETFTIIGDDAVLSWSSDDNRDYSYTIEIWKESLTQSAGDGREYKDFTDDGEDNGVWYELSLAEGGSGSGKIGNSFSAPTINHFTCVEPTSYTISSDNSQVFKFFFNRNEYTVKFDINTLLPEGETELPEGSVIRGILDYKVKYGYKVSNITPEWSSIAGDIVYRLSINGYADQQKQDITSGLIEIIDDNFDLDDIAKTATIYINYSQPDLLYEITKTDGINKIIGGVTETAEKSAFKQLIDIIDDTANVLSVTVQVLTTNKTTLDCQLHSKVTKLYSEQTGAKRLSVKVGTGAQIASTVTIENIVFDGSEGEDLTGHFIYASAKTITLNGVVLAGIKTSGNLLNAENGGEIKILNKFGSNNSVDSRSEISGCEAYHIVNAGSSGIITLGSIITYANGTTGYSGILVETIVANNSYVFNNDNSTITVNGGNIYIGSNKLLSSTGTATNSINANIYVGQNSPS